MQPCAPSSVPDGAQLPRIRLLRDGPLRLPQHDTRAWGKRRRACGLAPDGEGDDSQEASLRERGVVHLDRLRPPGTAACRLPRVAASFPADLARLRRRTAKHWPRVFITAETVLDERPGVMPTFVLAAERVLWWLAGRGLMAISLTDLSRASTLRSPKRSGGYRRGGRRSVTHRRGRSRRWLFPPLRSPSRRHTRSRAGGRRETARGDRCFRPSQQGSPQMARPS